MTTVDVGGPSSFVFKLRILSLVKFRLIFLLESFAVVVFILHDLVETH